MPENGGAFPDDVPIADAVEQQLATGESPSDDDNGMTRQCETDVPLEATDSDWREQQETVLIDSEFEDLER